MDNTHLCRPLAGCHARFGRCDGGRHDILACFGGISKSRQRRLDGGLVPRSAPVIEAANLFCFDRGINYHDPTVTGHQRRDLALLPFVHANNDGLACFDAAQAVCIAIHQSRFHVIDGFNSSAHTVEVREFQPRAFFQGFDFCIDRRISIEQVVKFQQVRLIRHNLLHPHGPLLIPRTGQAERFVPRRQLHGARACFFR